MNFKGALTKLSTNAFHIAISVIVIMYVKKLKEISCDCSKDWRRDYINHHARLALVVIAVSVLMSLFGLELKNKYIVKLVMLFAVLYGITSLVNAYAMITYSYKLIEDAECKCASGWERNTLFAYSSVTALVTLLSAGVVIMFLIKRK